MRNFIVIAVMLGLLWSGKTSAQVLNRSSVEDNDTAKVVRTILIPTAFSPNGDGLNDVFKLVNVKGEKLIEFRVFNRWGTILYSSRDIYQGWDGNYKGQQQPTGVYGYAIKIVYDDGVEEIYKGTVTLIR